MIYLCHLDEIPDPGSAGFRVDADAGALDIMVIRRGNRVYGYLNTCPHTGVSLDWLPGRFLTPDNELIVCATHGALFRIADGYCVSGPCAGNSLDPVELRVDPDSRTVSANLQRGAD